MVVGGQWLVVGGWVTKVSNNYNLVLNSGLPGKEPERLTISDL